MHFSFLLRVQTRVHLKGKKFGRRAVHDRGPSQIQDLDVALRVVRMIRSFRASVDRVFRIGKHRHLHANNGKKK